MSDDANLSALTEQFEYLDPTIRKYLKITSENPSYIRPEKLEEFRISKTSLPQNTIKIVDITHSQYDSLYVNSKDETTGMVYRNSKECLGIIPVITTPLNALFY